MGLICDFLDRVLPGRNTPAEAVPPVPAKVVPVPNVPPLDSNPDDEPTVIEWRKPRA